MLTAGDVLEKSTYYVLDAQGNTMSVYERVVDEMQQSVAFYQAEKHVYGSSRLGIMHDSISLLGSENEDYDMAVVDHVVGKRNYELSNHLGNVLSIVSDKPVPHDEGSDGDVDWYLADIRASQDYSPFRVTLSGRNFSVSDDYRYGFNSMEKDNEIKGNGNSYDFGARMLDPRLGRWLSIDPLVKKYPGLTPYQFSFNCPTIFKDPNGEDGILTIDNGKKNVTLETTVYLYGVTPEQGALLEQQLNTYYSTLSNTQKIRDPRDPNVIWTASINVKFVYSKKMADNIEAGNANLPDGSNKMHIATQGRGGVTHQGFNSGYGNTDPHVVVHEVLHMLGFDERYAVGVWYAEFATDILSTGQGNYENKKIDIRPFHLVDVLDFAINEFGADGVYTLFSESCDEDPTVIVEERVVDGVKSKHGVYTNKSNDATTGYNQFKVDDTSGGIKCGTAKEKQRVVDAEKRVVKSSKKQK